MNKNKNKYEERLKSIIECLKPIACEHELIRVGNQKEDGGYLLPDDLKGITACFSPGVSTQVAFDQDIMNRGITSYLADASVTFDSIDLSGDFHFTEKHIGVKDSNPRLDKLLRKYPQMCLDTWINSHKVKGDLLLQMDIEGAEYMVLDGLPLETLERFRVMAIEFHGLKKILPLVDNNLLPPLMYGRGEIMHRVFKKLAQSFSVVHIHPNNNTSRYLYLGKYQVPKLLEITFLRKDRISKSSPAKLFPHPLDRKNNEDRPDIVLSECWYK